MMCDGKRAWRAIVWLVGCIALIGLGIAPVTARTESGPIVRCDPVFKEIAAGEMFTLDIYVENVTDLYAADVHLRFDNSRLEVVDASANEPGVQVAPLGIFLAPDYIVRNLVTADATNSTVAYAATQLYTDHPSPVSGSGPLARITFRPLMEEITTLTFTYQKLARSDGSQIAASTQSCVVNIGPTAPPTAVGLSRLTARSIPFAGWSEWLRALWSSMNLRHRIGTQ